MGKNIDEFKEALIEGETFSGELNNITSLEEVLDLAKKNGYDFTMEQLEADDISDDILDCVAAAGNTTVRTILNIPQDVHDSTVILVK